MQFVSIFDEVTVFDVSRYCYRGKTVDDMATWVQNMGDRTESAADGGYQR